MPELPEVESVRRSLAPRLIGRSVQRVHLFKPGQVRYPEPEAFAMLMQGAHFTDIGRRGKYLLFELAGTPPRTLVAHLRMSGRLVMAEPEEPLVKHTHVVFDLDDGRQLRYIDMRTFGGFHLLGPAGEGAPEGLVRQGPEPMDAAFTPGYLLQCFAGRSARVKSLLLDQHLISGLGNIYADEALHAAGVHPERPGETITAAEAERLCTASRDILQRSIERRGTSFSLYFDGEGRRGEFYNELRVFDRSGQACHRCGATVEKIRVGGRGTHFCPQCQH